MAEKNQFTLIVLIEDLLKLANEKLSDEINWIIEGIRYDLNSISTVIGVDTSIISLTRFTSSANKNNKNGKNKGKDRENK